MLVDLAGTAEKITAALGRDGYARKMLQEDRDQQIAAAARSRAATTRCIRPRPKHTVQPMTIARLNLMKLVSARPR
jgi:hypothetical protein